MSSLVRRCSHVGGPGLVADRRLLSAVDFEEGMLLLMDDQLRRCAAIQQTWLGSGAEPIKYEELLERDVEILEPLLMQKCPLGVPARQVREAVLSCRFERLTGGRVRGQEDVLSHERKGVAGDWRNHFTERVPREFKARFGELLVATGCEKDLHW